MDLLNRIAYITIRICQINCNVLFWFSVIDDENPTEVTAGAIVTVTVNLVRHDMSSLFGDDSIADAEPISELLNDSEKIAAAVEGAVGMYLKHY